MRVTDDARTLAQTPLHDWHAAHGGRMVDFAGWSMPVQYASIVAEHHATRNAVGLFDVSHMGRLRFRRPRTPTAFSIALVTRRVAGMKPGQVRYALVTNDDGGILDDVLVYHLADAQAASLLPAGRQRQQPPEDSSIGSMPSAGQPSVELTDTHARHGDDRRARPAGARRSCSR